MSEEKWTAVDDYIADRLLTPDDALSAALADSAAAGLPSISVSACQGKLLHLLALANGAKSILEIGTLGGYSSIWLARALPEGGRLVTLEIDPKHAEVARANIARAGLMDRVDLRVGPALETLPDVEADGCDPFDMVFIDADKQSIPEYFDWAVRLTRTGGLIIVDNVVRRGELVNDASDDPNVLGVRRFHEQLAKETRASATTIQTVGAKGYDGLTFAIVTEKR